MIYLGLEANSVIVRKHLIKLEIAAVLCLDSKMSSVDGRYTVLQINLKNRSLVCLFAYSFLI